MKKLLSVATISLAVLSFLVAAQAQTTTTPKKNTSAQNAKEPKTRGANCNGHHGKMAGTPC
jgi:hypothetical protein